MPGKVAQVVWNLNRKIEKKMQLDVDMSPPANSITFRLGLNHLTFDLDSRDI